MAPDVPESSLSARREDPRPVAATRRAYGSGSTTNRSKRVEELAIRCPFPIRTPVASRTPVTFRTCAPSPCGRAPKVCTRASAPTEVTAARSRPDSTPARTDPPKEVTVSPTSTANAEATAGNTGAAHTALRDTKRVRTPRWPTRQPVSG